MKTFFTFLFICVSLVVSNKTINAQCTPPSLNFVNPVLVSGQPLAEGAVYKFPAIITGVDCFIKLVKLNGGATLISMETPGQGYGDAWQPIIDGPGAPSGNKSWIDWEISFKTAAGDNYTFPCLEISAIDIDGDNSIIGEFVESDSHVSYTLPKPTLLTVTDQGNNQTLAQAPVTNRPGIDTAALDVRINFLYNNKNVIKLKLGSTVFGTGSSATQRLNCIYFKNIVQVAYSILPVKYISFTATGSDKKVNINWATDYEVNNNYFELERSSDGINFKNVAVVLDALTQNGNIKNYSFTDKSIALAGKQIVYYRLKQVDVKGDFTNSNVVMVRLLDNKGVSIKVVPNPFVDNLSLNFTAIDNGTAMINLQTLSGRLVASKTITIIKGNNNVKIGSLTSLPAGMYVAQVIVNGVVADYQKVIKD